MSLYCTYLMFTIVFFAALFLVHCAGKVSYYIVTEHATISHGNPKYVRDLNFTSTRHGRRSPMYYVDIHYTALLPFDEKFKADFYFYEFLSNEYRRGFVEMHFTWCNLIHKDMFFGAAMRQGKLAGPCPYPPGDYHMYNMSIPSAAIPPGFPFTKGRIYANLTNRGEDVFGGYIDMELKERRTRPAKTSPNTPPPGGLPSRNRSSRLSSHYALSRVGNE